MAPPSLPCTGNDARGTFLRKTKIVCTVGPCSSSARRLGELLDAGMSVARFNMSHGTHVSHANTLRNLRCALAHRPLVACSALLDTRGPEIRSGMLRNHLPMPLRRNQHLRIISDYTYIGSAESQSVACSYAHLAAALQPGQRILIADGNIQLTVLECRPRLHAERCALSGLPPRVQHCGSILCRVDTNCVLLEHKNMFIPGVNVNLPTLTEKDRRDIQFAVDEGFDILSGSLIRTSDDVSEIRRAMGHRGSLIRVHAKVESSLAVKNFRAVLHVADGVHVSRGDLGMEMNLEKVFLAQKMVVCEANAAGKPVVVATQVLHSMLSRPHPSSAECNDIANAVIDGADCVMLSGETARGMFPARTVCIMDRVCCEAERCLAHRPVFGQTSLAVGAAEAIASSAVELAVNVGAQMIVVVDDAGMVGQLVSKYRPEVPVLVFTRHPTVARQITGVCQGIYSVITRSSCERPRTSRPLRFQRTQHTPLACSLPIALAGQWVGPCDTIILVASANHTPNRDVRFINDKASPYASVHQVAAHHMGVFFGKLGAAV